MSSYYTCKCVIDVSGQIFYQLLYIGVVNTKQLTPKNETTTSKNVTTRATVDYI